MKIGTTMRALTGRPGRSMVIVLMLSAAIGLATAAMVAVNAVLLRDLPVAEQDRLVVSWLSGTTAGSAHLPVTYAALQALNDGAATITEAAGVSWYGASEKVFDIPGAPLVTGATWVTGNFFEVLGARTVTGRVLQPSDDRAGADPALVLSHRLWRTAFAEDPRVVGSRIRSNGKSYQIVGVMAAGFEYPAGADVWIPVLVDFPATVQPDAHPAQSIPFDVVARVQPRATVAAAASEFDRLMMRHAAQTGATESMRGTTQPLQEVWMKQASIHLWPLFAAVLLLALVACTNVANMLLVQGAERRQEIAVRRALGATRARILLQLNAEGAVLALAGGAGGLVFCIALLRVLPSWLPLEIPRTAAIEAGPGTLAAIVAITSLAWLLISMVPAIVSSDARSGSLRSGPRGGELAGTSRLRRTLVVFQVAIAVLAVSAAGLLLRSYDALQRAPVHFNPTNLAIATTNLPDAARPARSSRMALQDEMLAHLQNAPGVESAAAVAVPPFAATGAWTAPVSAEPGAAPTTAPEPAGGPIANLEVIAGDYFITMQTPITRGRAFDHGDREGSVAVAIVSESLADALWPGLDPLGRRIKLGPAQAPGQWSTVVGIAQDTRYRELAADWPTIYLPAAQFGGPVPLHFAVRSSLDHAALTSLLRQAVAGIESDWILTGVVPMQQAIAKPLARPRFLATVLGALAIMTLLVAAAGIHAAMSATVLQRNHELGVMMALGATRADAVRRILREAFAIAAAGIAIGVATSIAAGRLLRAALYEVAPLDPISLGAGAAALFFLALLSSWIPAMRAARIDPAAMLRRG